MVRSASPPGRQKPRVSVKLALIGQQVYLLERWVGLHSTAKVFFLFGVLGLDQTKYMSLVFPFFCSTVNTNCNRVS